MIGIRHYKQVNSSNKQSKSALIQCSLMPVIAALVDIRMLLEPDFNDYTDTVINSPIYFLFECVFKLFFTCHNPLAYRSLPAPDSSSHFRNILFIQHRRRCQPFCFALMPFSTLLAGSARHLNLTWWICVTPSCTEINRRTWLQL